MRFYCPKCWKDFSEDLDICPYCGLKIKKFWDRLDRIEKLIISLNHPEDPTKLRSAWLLGKSGDKRALAPLVKICKNSTDPYLVRECVKAIAGIGGEGSIDILKEMCNHHAKMVRDTAQKAIEQLKTGPSSQ